MSDNVATGNDRTATTSDLPENEAGETASPEAPIASSADGTASLTVPIIGPGDDSSTESMVTAAAENQLGITAPAIPEREASPSTVASDTTTRYSGGHGRR